MPDSAKQAALTELKTIPGVGPNIAEDLWNLDIRAVKDLKHKNPEKLYLQLCERQGRQVDRCMLYVLRCAVYYASQAKHEAHLLLWWNWKDQKNRKGK